MYNGLCGLYGYLEIDIRTMPLYPSEDRTILLTRLITYSLGRTFQGEDTACVSIREFPGYFRAEVTCALVSTMLCSRMSR
jgi:hypothetical protein